MRATSRRSCSSTRTPSSSTRASAPRSAAALGDPDVGVAGCIGALGVRSIAWWEGSVTWASFIHRYGELGGGDLPGFAWHGGDAPAVRAHRRGRRRRRLPARALAVGRAQPALRRVARAAARLRRRLLPAGARGRPQGGDRRLPRRPQPLARAGQRPRGLDRGPHARRARSGTGGCPASAPAGGDWRGARAPRARPRPRPRARPRSREQLQYDAREREYRRELDEMTTSIGWRLTEPLRRANHWRRRARRGGCGASPRSAARISSLDTDRVARARCRPGGAGATAARRGRTRSSRAAAAAPPPGGASALLRQRGVRELDVRLGEVEDAVGLEPREQRVAGPTARAPRRARRPTARRRSRPRRGRRRPGTIASRRPSRSATKSSTAVSTPLPGPPSRAAATAVRQAAEADPGLVGVQAAARRGSAGGARPGSARAS